MINLRRYVWLILEDKVQDILCTIRRTVTYRNLIAFLLKLNDDELTDALETFVAKEKDPAGFLLLLEEEVKAGIDTNRATDLFVSLILIHQYSIDTIKQFLSIVSPDRRGIVSRKILKKLVESKQERFLVDFIKHFPEYRSLLPIL